MWFTSGTLKKTKYKLERACAHNFEDHSVIGVEEMNIPSAGKQITLLHDDSLSKNLKLVYVQPPARQAVIYMTMRVPELSFSYLKVGVTKTNHSEASVLKYWYRTTYWSQFSNPNLPVNSQNWKLLLFLLSWSPLRCLTYSLSLSLCWQTQLQPMHLSKPVSSQWVCWRHMDIHGIKLAVTCRNLRFSNCK